MLHRLFTEDAYKEFADIKSLPGFENYYCFDKSGQTPYYSVLLSIVVIVADLVLPRIRDIPSIIWRM